MREKNTTSMNVTISLNKDHLETLNKLCELEHRKRCNQIIHMMRFYIEQKSIKI